MKDRALAPSLSRRAWLGGAGALALGAAGCRSSRDGRRGLAIGYLNNVTHAQALVGAQGRWQRELGEDVAMIAFPAGPAVMEALLAGSLDVGFMGPTAVVNTFVRSSGRRIRVLSGACSGGASLVARKGITIRDAQDLRGKTVTASLIGSTPDVSLRAYLADNGLRSRDRGGDVTVVPMANAEALELLKRGQLDAAWAQEPWASRMVATAGATRVLDERDLWPERRFPTSLLVASTSAVSTTPERLSALVRLLHDDTSKMSREPEAALDDVSRALARALGKKLPAQVLSDAWSRMELLDDPMPQALARVAASMRAIGYLPEGSIDGIVHQGLVASRERAL